MSLLLSNKGLQKKDIAKDLMILYSASQGPVLCPAKIAEGGFPGGSAVKNSPTSAGDACSIPVSIRSSGAGNGSPLQCSCLENPMDEEPGGLQSMGSRRVRHD